MEKGQIYLSNEDKRRSGRTRTVTVERTVMAKRVYDTQKQLYAVAVSRIDAYPDRPSMVGKKRRVFIKVKSLLSAQYSICGPLGVTATEIKNAARAMRPISETAIVAPTDSYGVPLPVPVPCGEAVSTIVDGLETVPGL